MGKILYHWTSEELFAAILVSKRLELEGYHYIEQGARSKYPIQAQKVLDEQYKLGRWVWFTESKTYGSSDGEKNTQTQKLIDHAITIDSDLIEVKKWHYVKRDNKDNPAFGKLAATLDQAAKSSGDDPYNWWVSSEPINLDGLKFGLVTTKENMDAFRQGFHDWDKED